CLARHGDADTARLAACELQRHLPAHEKRPRGRSNAAQLPGPHLRRPSTRGRAGCPAGAAGSGPRHLRAGGGRALMEETYIPLEQARHERCHDDVAYNEAGPDRLPKVAPSGLYYLTMPQLTTKADVNYIVKGLLGLGEISSLYGPSGCGKTFLAIDVALHVA